MEDTQNKGLTVADNVIHEPEGYKVAHLESAGAFSTSGGMNTIISVVSHPIGSAGDQFSAWIDGSGVLQVGINGNTATTSSTGFPLSHSTVTSGSNISFMSVTEYQDDVYFTVQSFLTGITPSTLTSISFSGQIPRT